MCVNARLHAWQMLRSGHSATFVTAHMPCAGVRIPITHFLAQAWYLCGVVKRRAQGLLTCAVARVVTVIMCQPSRKSVRVALLRTSLEPTTPSAEGAACVMVITFAGHVHPCIVRWLQVGRSSMDQHRMPKLPLLHVSVFGIPAGEDLGFLLPGCSA